MKNTSLIAVLALLAAGAAAGEPAHPPVVRKALDWIVQAQHEDGGWGAGSHARQDVRDPTAVQTDPATTAFVGLALLRAGHTPVRGEYAQQVERATSYLVRVVESAPAEGPRITNLTGTQPQAKMGALVDTPLVLQFLSRALEELPEDHEMRARVDKAVDVVLAKLEGAQGGDGNLQGGGWAPVLQSALGVGAMEAAGAAGKAIQFAALDRAREAQKSNVGEDGVAVAEAAAGVELYAFAGGARGAAAEARAALELVDDARRDGRLERDADVSVESLRKLGVDRADELAGAYVQLRAQSRRLRDETLLSGFGNNGGEEYLSYLMTSETLVILGGEGYDEWAASMRERLAKIQSPDGSWTGHHCITSPVFCTAAVVQVLTVERDVERLRKASTREKAAAVDAEK